MHVHFAYLNRCSVLIYYQRLIEVLFRHVSCFLKVRSNAFLEVTLLNIKHPFALFFHCNITLRFLCMPKKCGSTFPPYADAPGISITWMGMHSIILQVYHI